MADHRIVIDTDPGIDDAMAIFYALASPQIEVLGLTTVFGNVATELATENALRLLEVAGSDAPVAHGAARPLAAPYRGPVAFVHGEDGQGNGGFTPPRRTRDDRRAVEFIIDTVSAYPKEITLVALGPLTNLAMVLLARPETAQDVREVVLMGGNAYVPGNASPAAEANVLNDPEAAELVLTASWPVTMVGLDVTHQIVMTPRDLDRIMAIESSQGRHLARCVPYYHQFYRSHVGSDGIYVHDSTTISYLLHRDAFETEETPIRVDTGDGPGRGKTWPWPDSSLPAVTVCRNADARRVIEAEITTLAQTAQ